MHIACDAQWMQYQSMVIKQFKYLNAKMWNAYIRVYAMLNTKLSTVTKKIFRL